MFGVALLVGLTICRIPDTSGVTRVAVAAGRL